MRATGNNGSANDKVMSIRLLLDGHNFSQASAAFRAATGEGGVGGEVAESVVVSFDTHKTVLLPAYLCEDGVGEDYLRFNGFAPAPGERVVVSEKAGETVAVMAVDGVLLDETEELLGRRAVYTSPLLEIACGNKRDINIFLTTGNAYVAVWDSGLRFAEVFPDSSADSVLYYLQSLGSEFKLKRFNINIGGEGSAAVVAAAAQYFKHVKQATLCGL